MVTPLLANVGKMVLMFVAPDQATAWIERNTLNRKLKQGRVDKFVHLLKTGQFKVTHQGVAIATDGSLLDGQHRLWAIILSGIGAWMWVCLDAPTDSRDIIDDTTPRSLSDRLRFRLAGDVSSEMVATARVMKYGPAKAGRDLRRFVSALEAAEFITPHADAIRFSLNALRKSRGVTSSIEWAVIARAYYAHNHDDLQRFAAILSSGVSDGNPESNTVISLREALRGTGKGDSPVARYGKVERTLEAFLAGEALTKIYAAKRELFPLPGESAAVGMSLGESTVALDLTAVAH
jgi:hypothetical protein